MRAGDPQHGAAAIVPESGPAGDVLAQLLRERLEASLPGVFGAASAAEVRRDLLRLGDWVKLPGGDLLFRQGERGDSMYVVVTGRLVALSDARPGPRRVVGEIRPGESVGEVGLLGGSPRTATVRAARDTVLLRISADAFQQLAAAHPEFFASTARLIVRRMTDVMSGRVRAEKAKNVAIVPLRPDPRLPGFVERLRRVLQPRGPTVVVDSAQAEAVLARAGVPRDGSADAREVVLSAWLDEQELRHERLLLRADGASGPWAARCIRQADTVLLLARLDASHEVDEHERALLQRLDAFGARQPELVFLHPPGTAAPVGVGRWLSARRVARHHHVRWDRDDDFRRLARFLAGDAVGVVMSGGGARALAHVGVMRALRDAGVEIDAVGGTSLGAVIAAMCSLEWDDPTIERRHRALTRRNPLGDLAVVPHLALVKGRRIDAALAECFGDADIEDAWRSFFCVSTNLTLARAEVHRRGRIAQALRASISLPGILPPVMIGEHLHVDGGILDNLPVEAMRENGVGRVIALDVDVTEELRMSGNELPTARKFLAGWFSGERGRTPGLGSILVKALTISSEQRVAAAIPAVDLYLNPEPAEIGFLEWDALDRAIPLGYRYARSRLAGEALERFRDAGAPATSAS